MAPPQPTLSLAELEAAEPSAAINGLRNAGTLQLERFLSSTSRINADPR